MDSRNSSCTEVMRKLCDYVDAVLPPGQHRRVELHLDRCPACNRTLDELRHTLAVLSHLPRPSAAPARIHEAVQRRLRDKPNPAPTNASSDSGRGGPDPS